MWKCLYYESAERVYPRDIFLEMILAARSSLDDQEHGNVSESAESVYPRGIFLEMILVARSSLDDQEYGNVYESAESVYPHGIFFEMILAARNFRLMIRNMEMFIKALKVCIHVAYFLK